jgi:hypothetical protein
MTNIEKRNFFIKELNSITEPNVREFVGIVLDGTGEWFYHDPASTSGKYHPAYALGDGGLMRHTRAVAYWVCELVRSELFNVNPHQTNLLIAAAIMHDIRKHTADGGYIAKHARASHDLILQTQREHPELITTEDAKYMADAVSTNMGIWGVRDGERKPTSDSEKLLHIADLMASRKEVFVNIFGTPNVADLNLPKMPSLDIVGAPKPKEEPVAIVEEAKQEKVDDGGDYVITFGRKYPNKTLAEIYQIDKDYLHWIAGVNDFFNQEAHDKVVAFLATKKA